MPYSALFERLRAFLCQPDTLLLLCGFSCRDAHISAVLEESLAATPTTAIISFQYCKLENEEAAAELASRRPNFSLYSSDRAVINCVAGRWMPGDPPNDQWHEIRSTFWDTENGTLKLGDFAWFARFLAHIQAERITRPSQEGPAEPVLGPAEPVLGAPGEMRLPLPEEGVLASR